MSYLHCPTCKRAFNLAVQATCPWCPVAATVVDPAADIVAAAERLAEAMARATPAERTQAAARIQHLQVFEPPPLVAPPKPSLVLSFALAVERRIADGIASARARAKLPALLGEPVGRLRRLRDRVRALAA